MNLEAVTSGNRLALSRLLTEVENDTAEGRAALDRLFISSGKAHLVWNHRFPRYREIFPGELPLPAHSPAIR